MPNSPENAPSIKIAKWIAMHGICSRRAAEQKLRAGEVTLNGEPCLDPATRITPEKDAVKIGGKALPASPPAARIWRFHKPKACLTSAGDPEGRRTIYDILPPEMKELKYIGRLDYNTEGLLLLTNSGALADAMASPKNALPRIYRVRAYGKIDPRAAENLRRGAVIDGVRYRPVAIAPEKRERASQLWFTLTLTEGKNREIRILMEYCGLQVTRLIRVSYGDYALAELAPGAWAEDVVRHSA